MENIRVRIAPSPTGNLHIGTARTALFNYLFARHNNGKMILRIEDTDLNRSTQESLQNILDGLRWLGIDWDEGPEVEGDFGPYFQSKKLDRYKEVLEGLRKKDLVYETFATEEEINERVEKFKSSKQYSSEKEKELINNLKNNPAYVFKAIKKDYTFKDLIKGEVTFEADTVDDLVLFKSDGMPTYNFAVVVDDIDMKISHVIRGDDHLSNTPKQIMIYDALEVEPPLFAHLGMILAKDEDGNASKMSKRHGATSVADYMSLGYLPEAIFNHIAFLGWSSGDDRETFTKEELIKEFTIERVSKSPSIFDKEKLNWYNQHYIMELSSDKFIDISKEYLKESGLNSEKFDNETLKEILELTKGRVSLLTNLSDEIDFFFNDNLDYKKPELEEVLNQPESKQVLEAFVSGLEVQEDWSPDALKDFLKKVQKDLKLKTRQVMMPVRVSLTAKPHGAELFKIISIMGKDVVLKRLNSLIG